MATATPTGPALATPDSPPRPTELRARNAPAGSSLRRPGTAKFAKSAARAAPISAETVSPVVPTSRKTRTTRRNARQSRVPPVGSRVPPAASPTGAAALHARARAAPVQDRLRMTVLPALVFARAQTSLPTTTRANVMLVAPNARLARSRASTPVRQSTRPNAPVAFRAACCRTAHALDPARAGRSCRPRTTSRARLATRVVAPAPAHRQHVSLARTVNSRRTANASPLARLRPSPPTAHAFRAIRTAPHAVAPLSRSAPAVLPTAPFSVTGAASRSAAKPSSSTPLQAPASHATRAAQAARDPGPVTALRARAPARSSAAGQLVHVTSPAANNGTISEPTQPGPSPSIVSSSRPLEWWEILLMALGCAFIFVLFLMCWRRRARKQRAKQTAAWAATKRLDPKTNWRWRLFRFGERLFGKKRTPVEQSDAAVESEAIALMKMRNAEEARHHLEMEKMQVFGAYQYERKSLASTHRPPSALPELDTQERVSRGSMYSSVTGNPRAGPEPRQPVSKNELASLARYPSSIVSAYAKPPPEAQLVDLTEAQAYAEAVRPSLADTHGAYWIRPNVTGNSGLSSNNPFRR
uniref:Uncharacterized protein n=1 Tax=Mycena chlorophos TaxID=658473 RepID=A0ABQ0LTP4_MYCCL|nr:predicted protein [Mycena chlorophos]